MTRVKVTPELLRWALDRAGLAQRDVSQRFPKLERWVRGEDQPTLKQVEQFAKATHAPIGYFFLTAPPVESVPIPDFRTIADERLRRPSPDLLDTVYLCQQRQEWYRDFSRMVGEPRCPFVGSVRVSDGIVATAASIRHSLNFDLDERRAMPTWTDALRRFIEQADVAGVMVMCSGVVQNNNRRRLDPDEFRGFALSDEFAPLVFINGADTKAAQMFTLAHELAHIWLGQSAMSDAQALRVPDHVVESWCNRIAAELLVPLDVVRSEYRRTTDLRGETDRLARRFKVSTLVILRRIHDAGGITRDAFWKAYNEEVDRLRAIPRTSGGDFYLTIGARASKRFARALVVSTLEGQTSFTEAFRLLGLKKMATFHDLGSSLGVGV
jgi:Zn-dependent peptidase ImmA (M78 family)